MKTITIVWQAFADTGCETTSLFVMTPMFGELDDLDICERVFRDTNLYQGEFWELIEPSLNPARSHTALSVGDLVRIDGSEYRCEMMGFSKLA